MNRAWSILRRLFRRRARPKIERLPPLDGRIYNVSPEEYYIAAPPEYLEADSYEYVWSVKALPPVGSQEVERRELVPALTSLIQGYLDEIRIGRYNDALHEVFGRDSIGAFTDDREMWSYIDHPSAFSPELVRRVQLLLADRFPLWRIVLAYEHLIMGVYPGGVWFGAQHDRVRRNDVLVRGELADGDAAFTAWSLGVQGLAERLYGPLRRQLADLRPRVAVALQSVGDRGIAPLAVYDTNQLSLAGGEKRPMLWCLEANGGIEWRRYLWVNHEKPGRLSNYPVDLRGLIGPAFTDREYPFRLVGYLIEDAKEPFDVRLEVEGSPPSPLARFEAVISDEELIGRHR